MGIKTFDSNIILYGTMKERKQIMKYSFKQKISTLASLLLAGTLCFPLLSDTKAFAEADKASETSAASEARSAETPETAPEEEIGKYGMLPIYGCDIKDGTYSAVTQSSSRMFRVVDTQLTVKDGQMEAVLTLSGTGYLSLFMGSAGDALLADESAYISYEENTDGQYTYTIPVKALNTALPCAAYSKRKELWYDRSILIDASSLPEDAFLIDLPDYDLIEAAISAYQGGNAESDPSDTDPAPADSNGNPPIDTNPELPTEPVTLDMADGEYSIELSMTGGSGKSGVVSPSLLQIQDKMAFVKIQWSSSNYDYMIVGGEKYFNEAEEGADSVFYIPILAMDTEMPVIADTLAMGDPHEIHYTFTFFSESIGPKSRLPQEAAMRVVLLALAIIAIGGILNYYVNKKRRV